MLPPDLAKDIYLISFRITLDKTQGSTRTQNLAISLHVTFYINDRFSGGFHAGSVCCCVESFTTTTCTTSTAGMVLDNALPCCANTAFCLVIILFLLWLQILEVLLHHFLSLQFPFSSIRGGIHEKLVTSDTKGAPSGILEPLDKGYNAPIEKS